MWRTDVNDTISIPFYWDSEKFYLYLSRRFLNFRCMGRTYFSQSNIFTKSQYLKAIINNPYFLLPLSKINCSKLKPGLRSENQWNNIINHQIIIKIINESLKVYENDKLEVIKYSARHKIWLNGFILLTWRLIIDYVYWCLDFYSLKHMNCQLIWVKKY